MAEAALEPRLDLLHHAFTHRDLPNEQEPGASAGVLDIIGFH